MQIMLFLRRDERVAKFNAVQKSTVEALNIVEANGGIPGFNQFDLLRATVKAAEPARILHGRILDLSKSRVTAPQVLMHRQGDPKSLTVKAPDSIPQLDKALIYRSKFMSEKNTSAWLTLQEVGGVLIPLLVTMKPMPDELKAPTFAHEITHWMDFIRGLTNRILAEKRAYFVGYHVLGALSPEFLWDDSQAIQAIKQGVANPGLEPTQHLEEKVVALSNRTGGDKDLDTLSDLESTVLRQLGL